MRLRGIVKWLESNVEEMRKSRQTTLSYLVSSALSGAHAGVHALGRGLPGKALDKHKIKRTYRFLKNEQVEVNSVMKALTEWAVGSRERVIVLLDWTDMGSYQQLVASVPISGRSIPIACVTTYKKGVRVRRRAEQQLLLQVAAWIPEDVERVVIADRGFDGTPWMSWLNKQGWRFIIRMRGEAWAEGADYVGQLKDLLSEQSRRVVDLKETLLTNKGCGPYRVVATWQANQKEPWFIVTDLQEPHARQILRLYAHRMWIEEMFRDMKNPKWGMGLRGVHLSQPQRYDRLFIVLALAYFFAFACGCWAEKRGWGRKYQANTEGLRQISLFRLGIKHLKICREALQRLVASLDIPIWQL